MCVGRYGHIGVVTRLWYTIYATLTVARERHHSRRKVDQAGHAPVLRLERRQSLLDLDLLEIEARARRRDQRAAEGVAAR